MLLHVASLEHGDEAHSFMSIVAIKYIIKIKTLYSKLSRKILRYNTYISSTQYFKNIFIPVQVVPFPENPLLHVHWKDPSVLLHVASLEHGDEAHSFISRAAIKNIKIKTLYSKLSRKILRYNTYNSSARYFPNIFLPVQVVPSPLNPLLHVHWKDPSVLLHVASLEHGDEAHSFMSIVVIKSII